MYLKIIIKKKLKIQKSHPYVKLKFLMLIKQANQKVLEDRQRIKKNSFKNVAWRQNAHLGSIYILYILLLYKTYKYIWIIVFQIYY